ncbi:MAG: chaperone modulator CbpM [Sphingobacterium sp.]
MEKTLFNLIDICKANNIERTFVRELHRNGLIEIIIKKEQEYLEEEQLLHVERYSTWYYELEVNMQGIEVVHHLLDKIEKLQHEIRELRAARK